MIHDLSLQNSIVNHFMAQLRDQLFQKSRVLFRNNLHRLGQVFALEISRTLNYQVHEVTSPLGIASVPRISDRIVLGTVLRAGLPMYEGLLSFFDEADSAFVASYRKHHADGNLEINMEYMTCPDMGDSVLILADPMIATGSSIGNALMAIYERGQPKKLHIACAVASKAGIDHLVRLYPDADIWAGAVDDELTAKAYIVPGLGDAGDLAFGPKTQG